MPRPPKQAEGGGREGGCCFGFIHNMAGNKFCPSVGRCVVCPLSCTNLRPLMQHTHTNGRRERRTTSDRSNQGADFYLRQKCSQVCKFVKSPRKITSQGRKQPPSQRLWNLLSPILRERHLLHSQSSLVSRPYMYALTS